ncbi:MAG: hypothetical protein ACRESJ_05875 [Pseudomonas sp.]|uniref:hypothetical protein n=1 Tax=Pseudomonas sp. TaxID=306 RepID=UPI003D70078A
MSAFSAVHHSLINMTLSQYSAACGKLVKTGDAISICAWNISYAKLSPNAASPHNRPKALNRASSVLGLSWPKDADSDTRRIDETISPSSTRTKEQEVEALNRKTAEIERKVADGN